MDSGERVSGRAVARALLVYTVTAWALRVFRLGHQSLWMDEVLSATNADHPWRTLVLDPTVDRNFPPLYNLLIHLVQQALGRSDVVLRLPSAVAGALSVPALYLATRRWFGDRLALGAAFLLAISPMHIWYSQEARPYAVLVLLALLTLWCLGRAIDSDADARWLVALVLTGTATFYTHLVAVPFLGIAGLYLLLRVRPRRRTRALVAIAVLALLALPQVLRFVGAPPTVSGNTAYHFEASHLAYTVWAFVVGYSLGPSLLELRGGMAAVRPYVATIGPVLAFTVLLALLGARSLWRSHREGLLVVAAWAVAVVGFAVVGATVSSHPYNVRYVLLALPPFLVLVAAGVTGLGPVTARVVTATAWGLVAAVSLINYYWVPKYSREDNRAAAAYLNAAARDGDLIIATAPYTAFALRYYRLRPALVLEPYPKAGLLGPGQAARELGGVVGQRDRVWLFVSREFHSDPDGQIADYLASRFVASDDVRGAGMRILRFDRRPTPTAGPEVSPGPTPAEAARSTATRPAPR